MQTKLVKLSQIHVNNANPRSIKDSKFDKLVTSLLVLPKMLELRPIVVDNTMTALGGNMRYRALCAIVDLDEQSIRERLEASKDYQAKTQAERDTLVSYWLGWKDNPTAPVINASNLSDAEKREFIIKDNVSFGNWDYDALANEWESDDLNEWGVDVWNDNETINNDITEGEKEGSGHEEYSRKIEVPTYEPSEFKPSFGEMYNCSKRDELIKSINAVEMPDDVKKFLVEAACRHTVFNYEKIADYYAQAPAEIQQLMEDSALVIIDYNDAIRGGFITLTKDLANAYNEEKGLNEDDNLNISEELNYDEE